MKIDLGPSHVGYDVLYDSAAGGLYPGGKTVEGPAPLSEYLSRSPMSMFSPSVGKGLCCLFRRFRELFSTTPFKVDTILVSAWRV